jgi:hypothetical protein
MHGRDKFHTGKKGPQQYTIQIRFVIIAVKDAYPRLPYDTDQPDKCHRIEIPPAPFKQGMYRIPDFRRPVVYTRHFIYQNHDQRSMPDRIEPSYCLDKHPVGAPRHRCAADMAEVQRTDHRAFTLGNQ